MPASLARTRKVIRDSRPFSGARCSARPIKPRLPETGARLERSTSIGLADLRGGRWRRRLVRPAAGRAGEDHRAFIPIGADGADPKEPVVDIDLLQHRLAGGRGLSAEAPLR